MAKASRGPFAKRQNELARQEKQREKRAKRLAAKQRQSTAVPGASDADPDLAGIQPLPAAEDEPHDAED